VATQVTLYRSQPGFRIGTSPGEPDGPPSQADRRCRSRWWSCALARALARAASGSTPAPVAPLGRRVAAEKGTLAASAGGSDMGARDGGAVVGTDRRGVSRSEPDWNADSPGRRRGVPLPPSAPTRAPRAVAPGAAVHSIRRSACWKKNPIARCWYIASATRS
jgi:hypothetical protein